MTNFSTTHKLSLLSKQDLEDIVLDISKRQTTSKLYVIRSIENKIKKELRGVVNV